MTQVKKWLPESNIKTSKPIYITPEPLKIERRVLNESLEDMIKFYTEKNMIEYMIDFIFKKELCNYYVKYSDDNEDEANFVHYLRRNRGFTYETESYETDIKESCSDHLKTFKEYKELMDEDNDNSTKHELILKYKEDSYKTILKQFVDPSLYEEVETGQNYLNW